MNKHSLFSQNQRYGDTALDIAGSQYININWERGENQIMMNKNLNYIARLEEIIFYA